jgi:hypothetical protein
MKRVPTTVFKNGVNRYLAIGVGGAAGAISVAGGIRPGDTIVQVLGIEYSGTGDTMIDLSDEFTVSDVNEISNTGGTATTSHLLFVTYDQSPANVKLDVSLYTP